MIDLVYVGTPMATSVTMIAMTTTSSRIVKPRRALPVCIFRSIERLVLTLREYIENVLSAKRAGRGIVLHRAHAPLGGMGHGVHGNAPQKAEFLVHLTHDVDALHQRFQIRRITLRADLHLNQSAIGSV